MLVLRAQIIVCLEAYQLGKVGMAICETQDSVDGFVLDRDDPADGLYNHFTCIFGPHEADTMVSRLLEDRAEMGRQLIDAAPYHENEGEPVVLHDEVLQIREQRFRG